MVQAELTRAAPLALAQPRWPRAVFVLVAIFVALVSGLVLGGQPARFASAGLMYAPAILLVGLLQLKQWQLGRVLSWIWFWLMLVGFAFVALALTFGAASGGATISSESAQQLVAPTLAILAILLVGVILAATPAWQKVGSALGATLNKHEPAHAQGTVALLIGSALALAPLALLGGRAPLLDLLNRIDPAALGMGTTEQLVDQISTVVWAGVFVLWAAAWPMRTTFQQALARLAIFPLRRQHIVPIVVMTLTAFALGTGLDWATRQIWGFFGWSMTDASIVTRLVPVATTPIGAIIIAVCAGTSEELLFRGLLQPRFGWLLANIGFASMHAFQYGMDGLVVVFIGGALLAYTRQRWNTSVAMGVHVGYDMLLLMLAAFGIG
jgi:membrane protease YdiL (CAAX protease family)